ncbi:putative alanine--tRNA ligase [Iris pallida]|uniref:Alanine--tRNA ligase n=1 Tax=Iris pallida TaxID=29817 RepID=A0AAX6EJ33_IRIPA|nr:putative alanine--tRNA ligase [Iris pallida]
MATMCSNLCFRVLFPWLKPRSGPLGLLVDFVLVYPDQARVVSIGRKTDDILANPGGKEWLPISMELYGGY